MAELDPVLSLALSMEANRGTYSLLLGSGTSRAAGIPTGWEITLDLVKRVAALAGEDAGPEPEVWYAERYGKEPDYSDLLAQIARSPAERSRLLRSYFEPTSQEREDGLKVPTAAHRALARLVAQGYVKVILETNFDRLMELALEDAGVVPTVISTPDAAVGALPLVHGSAVVLKLHGDYLDTRIKNTPEELATYDHRLKRLLDQVLDEYGLVVVGWSGEWDEALRAAIERCKSRRFTTYWALKGEPGERAKRLIELRRAVVLRITDADSFLTDTADKVESAAEVRAPHPLSVATAVAAVKRYLPDDRQRIRLADLFSSEVERVYARLDWQALRFGGTVTGDVVMERLRPAEAAVQVLLPMLATSCRWGDASQHEIWIRALERLGAPPDSPEIQSGLDIRYWAALLSLYACGMGALVGGHYGTLAAVFERPAVRWHSTKEVISRRLYPEVVLQQAFGRKIPGFQNRKTPASDRLHDVLRPAFGDLVPDDRDYDLLFDRFEFMHSLDIAGSKIKKDGTGGWAPVGRFGWRTSTYEELFEEVQRADPDWPPLRAGFLGGGIDKLAAAAVVVNACVRESGLWF